MMKDHFSYLFVQIAGQHICLIEEGDIAFSPVDKLGTIQTAGCTCFTQ